jgi:DNA (cytosine-5)-methyltransferase 1
MSCIDLFCGCGGFSLGMMRAGFHVLAAVDFNREAVQTARVNLGTSAAERIRHIGDPIAHILEQDLTELHPKDLARLSGTTPSM